MYFFEIQKVFIYCFSCFMLSTILIVLSYSLARATPRRAKALAYECGFSPFHQAQKIFNVHFYRVGILFLLFDLEIVVLRPWVYSLGSRSIHGVRVGVRFITLLMFGFFYEWLQKALDW